MTLLTNILLLSVLSFDSSSFDFKIGLVKDAIDEKEYLTALEYSKTAEEYVENSDQLGRVYWQRGRIYDWLNDPVSANNFYFAAARIYERDGNNDYAARLFENAGTVLLNNTVPNMAIDIYAEALDFAIKAGEYTLIARIQHDLGLAYAAAGKAEDALIWYTEAYTTLRIEEDKESGLYSKIYNNMGLLYEVVAETENLQSYYDTALYNYQQAINWATSDVDRVHALNNIGNVSRKRGDLTLAVKQLQETIEIGKGIGSGSLLIPAMNNLGIVYYEQGQESLADSLFQLAITTNIINSNLRADLNYQVMAFNVEELYVSYNYMQKLDNTSLDKDFLGKIKDVLINQQRLKLITTKQLLMIQQERMKEREALKYRKKLLIGLAVLLLISVCVSYVIWFFQRRRESLKNEAIRIYRERFNV